MNVKIGMNMLLWGIEISPRHIPVFENLAAAGYDGVEIPVVGQSTADLKTIATACDGLGLARTASAFVSADVNPISPNPVIRAAAVDNLKKGIDDAKLIGAEILVGEIGDVPNEAHGPTVDAVEVEVSCAEDQKIVRVTEDHLTEPVCRVQLQLVEITNWSPAKARLKVVWCEP